MRPQAATAALALGLLPCLVGTVLTALPAGAAAEARDRREPLWQTALGSAVEDQGGVSPVEAMLDPTSGDVLTLSHDFGSGDAPRRVRRTDGDTGETVWEVGIGPRTGSATELTLDAAGQRAVVAVSLGGGQRLTSIGLDGEVDWTVSSRVGGDVQALETNPVTGTTCFTTMTWEGGFGRRARNSWHLVCHDRAGELVGRGRLRHRGIGEGPSELAVNPELSTWYIAGWHRRRDRGSRTLLGAFREGGPGLWRVGHDRPRGDSRVESIAVDLGNNVVHVGGGDRAGARLLSWTADGRPKGDRTWASGFSIQQLVADAPRRRILTVLRRRDGGAKVLVLRSLGRQLRRFTHPGSAWAVRIGVHPDRRQVYAAGPRLAGYGWDGAREWHETGPRREVHDLVVDGERDRVLMLSSHYDDDQDQMAHLLTAWAG